MKFNVLGLDYLRLSMAALHKDFLSILDLMESFP
jgi:hypothetical protein